MRPQKKLQDAPGDRGQLIAGTIMGTAKINQFARLNAEIQFRPTNYTHDIRVLEKLERFVAINAAIEVDLSDQINSEMVDNRYLGAVGGAMDSTRGARFSRGDLPIVLLPSRTGKRGRIVARVDGPVSTPRGDAAIIVTEYGVADTHW